MMKKFLIFAGCVTLAACSSSKETSLPHDSASKDYSDAVLVQIGPQAITQQQLETRLQQLGSEDFAFAQSPLGKRNFLQLLAREKLALLDAQQKNLDKSDEYLSALEDKRAQLNALYQAYADELLLHLWQESLQLNASTQVTDEEIEAYYKKYPYEMTLKQIVLQDAQTADAVWRELKHNKNRWKELEHKYSVAPQYSRGKEFSFMPGEYIAEMEVIAANSPTGSVQGFIKTAQGFHIIMKTAERRLSLKDAVPRIRRVLENQKEDALLQNLQTKYKVVFYE